MKKIVWLGLGVWIVAGLVGCATTAAPAETTEQTEAAYHKISSEEAKAMMDAGGVTIVDVRTEEEYAEAHIPDAIHLPSEDIGEAQPEALPDQDAVLLVYCRSGRRSKEASDRLVKMGYTQVYDFGGITDWTYDTVKGEGFDDE